MNKENISENEYILHLCSLHNARYAVLIIRESAYNYDKNFNFLTFKELKWASQCYRRNQAGTGYPEILQSRLVKIEDMQ